MVLGDFVGRREHAGEDREADQALIVVIYLRPQPAPGQYYCVSGKVDSADKLYQVVESIEPDAKHGRCSKVPVPADGAGGAHMV